MDKTQRHSYLASNVKELLTFQLDRLPDQGCHDNVLFENGLLNWNVVKKECSLDECFPEEEAPDYIMAISRIYPVAYQVHTIICDLTTQEFKLKYEHLLSWTAKFKQLVQCFDLLQSGQPGCLVTSMLLLTSTVERLLGDIFLTCSQQTVPCPSLLKDLLKTQELRSLFGTSFMNCLEVCIGSPHGLNLRNLAWHGFLSLGELPAHYVSFLLILTLSLVDVAKAKNGQSQLEKFNERELIVYSEITVMKDVFQSIDLDDNSLKELFSRSDIVTSSMVSFWYLACDFFQQGRYELAVMIMLPQLEHTLRRLYACFNEMPERIQTAESAEFYTTFNEILSHKLANGTPNRLLQSLESCYIELLLDILVHPEGPRLRDHLSHGEVEIFLLPKYLANHVFCVIVALCLYFGAEVSRMDDYPARLNVSSSEIYGISNVNTFLEITETVKNYRSIFHPFSCIRRELSSLISSLLEWNKLAQPNEAEFQRNCRDDVYSKTYWRELINTILSKASLNVSVTIAAYSEETSICDGEVLEIMLALLDGNKLETLFRPRYELEVTALLRQVVMNSLRTSDQITQIARARYNEWEQKTLRSRQRNNYKRFWYYLPSIAQTLCLLTVTVVWEFTNLNNLAGPGVKTKKFLKKCLQCSENVASLSSLSRNRWLECNEVCKTWLHEVSINYG